ncbi:MAG TPA: CDP-alcohol phosphatidyltransferase family protein [Rhizomicrobium sp.]|jgi:CDP-diacylglycerol--glycerol-3-phosphate 3-phosphatidyltransferase
MTMATSITLLRLLAAAVILLCIYPHSEIGYRVAAVIFIGAIVSDILDGVVARAFNQVTTLGAKLDPLVDKILIYSALFSLMQIGAIAPIIVFPMFFRDMIVDGLRNKAAQALTVLGANVWGKIKFSFQSLSILCSLGYCISGNQIILGCANTALLVALIASVPGIIVIASAFRGTPPRNVSDGSSPLAKLPLTTRFF